MGNIEQAELVRQHLIDPAVCFRCDACEGMCPTGAVSHVDNYVVDNALCDGCGTCITGCPSGAANSWRLVRRDAVYSVEEQHRWTELPPETISAELLAPDQLPEPVQLAAPASHAPASAAVPRVQLYSLHHPATATIVSNQCVTATAADTAIHHIVLQFAADAFPVLEGQTLGIVPPGVDAHGHAHFARAYSVASERDGEHAGCRDIALTVKRVTRDHAGQPVRGVASNHLCDLAPGQTVQAVGPFGSSFLMPDDPAARLLMICTGTGIAPMRAMIQRRSRTAAAAGSMLLLYGGRTRAEMAYLAELAALDSGLLDMQLALSREPDQPKQYVQDLLHAQADRLIEWLADDRSCIYLCGLRGMEDGVTAAMQAICAARGIDWTERAAQLRDAGRLHIETY